ncbi:ATP-binding protein [Streptomyces sp. NPDC052496]|uniref:ATP-binding protein n=1 Tax=Streptomyces sp. NPDC052496 TaxID=3154951 RepID=UPI003425E404
MIATTSRPTGPPGYTETLSRTPGSAATARRLVRAALAAWDLEELAEDGALIVSELVCNAVRHARSRSVRVSVTRPGAARVRIAVVDKSMQLPELREPGGEDESGRGLTLVAGLAPAWGADPLPWGKRVWAELHGKETRTGGGQSPWVGDLIHDEDARRRGIVTDVHGGTVWVLRPEWGQRLWTSRRPDRLTLIMPREQMEDRR